MKEVKPIADSTLSKKAQVEQMFDSISHKYDFLNHFLSLGIDKRWRKKAIAELEPIQPKRILDVATGTGDLALATLTLEPEQVIGVDISEGMLSKGREKIERKQLQHKVTLQRGDSEDLQFEDNSFDGIVVAFGVRNFENLKKGLAEMKRVLRPGGKVVILEFSKPNVFPVKQLYNFYFQYVLPLWGKRLSKDQSAYSYLPESVKHFPEGDTFLQIMNDVGYKDYQCKRLTFGICSIYTGLK